MQRLPNTVALPSKYIRAELDLRGGEELDHRGARHSLCTGSIPPMARTAQTTLARMLLVAALLGAFFVAGLSPAAAAPKNSAKEIADTALAQAKALQADWGRCPTARPANALLSRATRTKGISLRARLAVKAVDAFEKVAAECIQPVDQPTIIVPPSEGPVPPA